MHAGALRVLGHPGQMSDQVLGRTVVRGRQPLHHVMQLQNLQVALTAFNGVLKNKQDS